MVLRNSFYNLLGLGLPLVVAVFAIPLLINTLGESRFGILTLIWAVVSYFGLFDLGLGRAVTHKMAIAIANGRREELDAIVGTSSVMMLMLGLFGGGVMLAIAPFMGSQLAPGSDTFEVASAFVWMAAAMPAIVLTSGYRGMLEATDNFVLVNLIRIPMGVFTFAGPLLTLWLGYASLGSIAATLALGRIVACIAHGWFALRAVVEVRRHGHFDAKLVHPLFYFGGWLSIMNIFGPLIGYVDRFIVGIVIGPQAATYFVTPQEIASKVSLIPMAISTAVFPVFAAESKTETASALKSIKQLTVINALITMIPSLIIAIFSFQIMEIWIGANFAEKTSLYLSIFAIGYFINSIAHVPLTFIIANEGSRRMSALYFVEAVCYAAALYIAGSKFGLLAAVYVWLARIIVDTMAITGMCVWYLKVRWHE